MTTSLEEIANRIACDRFPERGRSQSRMALKNDILSALRNERERLKNLIIEKRDGTMERRTGGYEPEVYYLKYSDVKEVCNELLEEIDL